MSVSREDILKELGLTPVWRLRTGVDAAVASSAGASPATDLFIQGVDERGPLPHLKAAVGNYVGETDAGGASALQNTAPGPITVRGLPKVRPLDARATQIATLEWPQLKESVAGCLACPLHQGRTRTVFGVGDEAADWLFVGEGPGAEEDAKGEPFVGQAGKLLDNMLAAIKLKRGRNVYIANVVKCRPPGNRNPEPDEIRTCEPFLFRQIASIQPRVVIALGAFAAHTLLNTQEPISKLRG